MLRSLIPLLLILSLASCDRPRPADPRIGTTRGEVAANMFRNRTGDWQAVKADVLAALDATTNASLATPRAAAALVSEGFTVSDPRLLRVWWVEGAPTVDGVELSGGTPAAALKFTVPAEQLGWARDEAKSTVLFKALIPLDAGQVRTIRAAGTSWQLHLTRGGNAVGTPVTVRKTLDD